MNHDCTRDGHVTGEAMRCDSVPGYRVQCVMCGERSGLATIQRINHRPHGYTIGAEEAEREAKERAWHYWEISQINGEQI